MQGCIVGIIILFALVLCGFSNCAVERIIIRCNNRGSIYYNILKKFYELINIAVNLSLIFLGFYNLFSVKTVVSLGRPNIGFSLLNNSGKICGDCTAYKVICVVNNCVCIVNSILKQSGINNLFVKNEVVLSSFQRLNKCKRRFGIVRICRKDCKMLCCICISGNKCAPGFGSIIFIILITLVKNLLCAFNCASKLRISSEILVLGNRTAHSLNSGFNLLALFLNICKSD